MGVQSAQKRPGCAHIAIEMGIFTILCNQMLTSIICHYDGGCIRCDRAALSVDVVEIE